ncbi:Clas108 [Clostera anastomosis granulovirus B]|uniref:Clas108 n=1 Tax=Clostera anastomosis granulovirus B TaxID=1986290 RepID=A0A0K0WSC3_9BBAC|nr:Clas108 [Clostera anastomosis granulovirus B]AKS25451.1 Clas108 [Clostera anastomosis granulovirus B]
MGLCCNSCLDKINITEMEEGWDDENDGDQKRCCCCCTWCRFVMCLLFIGLVVGVVFFIPSFYLGLKTYLKL